MIKSNAAYSVEHSANGKVTTVSGEMLKMIMREAPNSVRSYMELTPFDKSKIRVEGSRDVWISYEGKVVARFKHYRAKANANHFVKFLVKNAYVEEYFRLRGEGVSPEHILKPKGYVNLNVLNSKK